MGLGVSAATGACEGAVVCPIKTIKVGQVSNAGSNASSIPDIPVTAATLARLAQRYLPEFSAAADPRVLPHPARNPEDRSVNT
jgi:hypothetical protein